MAAIPTRASRLLPAVAVLLALGLIALGVLAWRLAGKTQPVIRSLVSPPKGGAFYLESGGAGPVAVSPDGQWIAYTTSDPEGGDGTMHIVRPDASEHRELTNIASQVYGLCWTPDGSHVIFASEQRGPTTLWAVEVESGNEFSVTRGPGVCASPAMAADGRRLVFNFSSRRWYLYLASEPGGAARRVLVEPLLEEAYCG